MIAEVIINRNAKNLNRTFDYHIPTKWEDVISVGTKVLIPFGRQKELEEGFVVALKEKSEFPTKDIAKLEEGLQEKQIELARWMAKRYFCQVSECIKLMQTPGTRNKKSENRIGDKTIQVVYLAKSKEEINLLIETEKIKSPKHQRILNFVADNEGCTISEIEMFTEGSRAVVNTLIKHEYLELVEQKIERDPLKNKQVEKSTKYSLTEEQKKAFEAIQKASKENRFEEFLLFGITGSGKTEIYLQTIEEVIQKGKTAIVLVPEISLTPQIIERFIARFGKESIAVLHSKLSIGERHDEWIKIKEGKAKIVIGARSAIFAPIQNLGIIIIDEEHDSSYQSESSPKYQAKEIARKLAKQNQIPLVLGSATPDLTTYQNALNKQTTLLTLSQRANQAHLPKVEIIDLKQELAEGNHSMLSRELYQSIEQNINDKNQTILFLNRRGFSTFIMCRDCGYTVKCKNCNISMTYHRKENKLKCHYCGQESPVVTICPECGSQKIRYFGTGTQKLEEEIHKQFPSASTIRMDIDTVSKKNSHEKILTDFQEKQMDILIGTQMVVKGHHFPKVTLVGVIAADSSLGIDDYRANERTFQILTQVAGRAGRESLPGKVIIQTYNPDHFSIQAAQKQDYQTFFETEIALRNQLKYPPFCDIIVIGISSSEEEKNQKIGNWIYQKLLNLLPKSEYAIFKPMPAPIDKIQNRYRWRIILKGNMNQQTNEQLNKLMEIITQKNQKDIRVTIDVNPNYMN
jgi:primosomal protein N' (replication factor Y)